MDYVIQVLNVLCVVLSWAIIIRAIMTWFNPRPDNPVFRVLLEITEPILGPLRRIIPRIGLIDITPMVAIILLWIIRLTLGVFYA